MQGHDVALLIARIEDGIDRQRQSGAAQLGMDALGTVPQADVDAFDPQRTEVVEMAREQGALVEAEQALGRAPLPLPQTQSDPRCQDHRVHPSPPCVSAPRAGGF